LFDRQQCFVYRLTQGVAGRQGNAIVLLLKDPADTLCLFPASGESMEAVNWAIKMTPSTIQKIASKRRQTMRVFVPAYSALAIVPKAYQIAFQIPGRYSAGISGWVFRC
jgi:hypothetical protein